MIEICYTSETKDACRPGDGKGGAVKDDELRVLHDAAGAPWARLPRLPPGEEEEGEVLRIDEARSLAPNVVWGPGCNEFQTSFRVCQLTMQ